MSKNLSAACIRVATLEGHGIFSCSRNNGEGLRYIVTHGNDILYSCANNGAGGDVDIRWRYRGSFGDEPTLPSAVIEFVEDLVRSEDNKTIDHYNAEMARRGVPKHKWARRLSAEAVVA